MRPWLHIPVLIFLGTLALAAWVAFRDVPLERSQDRHIFASDLEEMPPPLPEGVLAGQLLDEQGFAVTDADLSTQQGGRILWTQTDEQGYFELTGLFSGPLQVAVNVPGRLPEIMAVPEPARRVKLRLTQPLDQAPTPLDLQSSDWGGRIRNPLEPSRLEGFEVWLVPSGPAEDLRSGVPRRVTTAADGSFRIAKLLHAPYEVHVLPPEHEGALEPNLLVPWGGRAPRLEHGSGPPTDAWELVTGELHGQIFAEGSPVRAALVMLEALIDPDTEQGETRVLAPAQTDREGRWSIQDLPPGRYRIRVRGGGLQWEQEVVLPPATSLNVQF